MNTRKCDRCGVEIMQDDTGVWYDAHGDAGCEGGDGLHYPKETRRNKKGPYLRYPTFPEGTKIGERPEATPEEHAERIGVFRDTLNGRGLRVVQWTGRHGKLRELLIDMQTANAVCTVYDASAPQNQALVVKLEPDEMGKFAWKCVK
jgi:hypothetical protein